MPGETRAGLDLVAAERRRFNPPPALMPGETLDRLGGVLLDVRFNPPPALMPGETSYLTDLATVCGLFQSAPGVDAGGNAASAAATMPPAGFNPPPALMPGETLAIALLAGRRRVSIRPRR